MVNPSPWPIMTSVSLLCLTLNFIDFFHYYKGGASHFCLSILFVCFYLFRWLSDIIVEATFEGNHTHKVQQGIRLGMCLFIASEAMFFFSFFWGFFHCTLSPSAGIGCIWPPVGVETLSAWGLPLWNTIILLSSGVTITCAHRAILAGERLATINGIIWTVGYGLLFTCIQAYEYFWAPFSMNDGVFGSLFFMLTGFHGFHVFVGSIFLLVCLSRQVNYHFTRRQHVGFECGIWYWHFVDVIWLGLFVIVYIWGG
jgi:heme/copper-type cytochrome/quinol oxidase subunit 3